jgi:hypothetical protein
MVGCIARWRTCEGHACKQIVSFLMVGFNAILDFVEEDEVLRSRGAPPVHAANPEWFPLSTLGGTQASDFAFGSARTSLLMWWTAPAPGNEVP